MRVGMQIDPSWRRIWSFDLRLMAGPSGLSSAMFHRGFVFDAGTAGGPVDFVTMADSDRVLLLQPTVPASHPVKPSVTTDGRVVLTCEGSLDDHCRAPLMLSDKRTKLYELSWAFFLLEMYRQKINHLSAKLDIVDGSFQRQFYLPRVGGQIVAVTLADLGYETEVSRSGKLGDDEVEPYRDMFNAIMALTEQVG